MDQPSREAAHEQIMELTDGRGVDLAVEFGGVSPYIGPSVCTAPQGGEVLFLGIPYADVSIERFFGFELTSATN